MLPTYLQLAYEANYVGKALHQWEVFELHGKVYLVHPGRDLVCHINGNILFS